MSKQSDKRKFIASSEIFFGLQCRDIIIQYRKYRRYYKHFCIRTKRMFRKK